MTDIAAKQSPSVPIGACSSILFDLLEIEAIRTDGVTQCPAVVAQQLIDEYAALMIAGTVFPPVRVSFDGEQYWLTDGFQRIAAAKTAGQTRISVAIRTGSLTEARWDSYSSNADYGLRRTSADIEIAVKRALVHPNAATLSNVQLAKHLNVPETTLRRWRKCVSSPVDEDTVRVVERAGDVTE